MDASDRAILRGARAGFRGHHPWDAKVWPKKTEKTYCRWAPDPVINRVITPISRGVK